MALPVRFEVIGESLETPFRDDFPNYTDGLVRGAPGGFVLTPVYAKHAGDIYGMALRSDDAWVVTFPKCGDWNFFLRFLFGYSEQVCRSVVSGSQSFLASLPKLSL